jgi:hypothetical protein
LVGKTNKSTCSLKKVKSQKCGPMKERKKGGEREETKEHLFGETKYKANKTPQMWSKKIPRRKTGRMEREEEHTCSSAFSVAGIAFAFVVDILSVLVRARAGGFG